jgi:hypothetical protein
VIAFTSCFTLNTWPKKNAEMDKSFTNGFIGDNGVTGDNGVIVDNCVNAIYRFKRNLN